jgi:hypothetical protein
MSSIFLLPAYFFWCSSAVSQTGSGQPQFWFDPLPELPGGASEPHGSFGPATKPRSAPAG